MEVRNYLQTDGTDALTTAETHHDRERVCTLNSICKEFRTSYRESWTPRHTV